jgi:hypothetical protein
VAGDGDRAAVGFLGTKTPGSTQAASFGKSADGDTFTGGEWHMYVSTTYDRGRTWTTVDATPKDPVQRGCIWNGGGSNVCRNLLDFNDITLDKTGRVLIGIADGCTGMRSDCPTVRDKSENKHEDQGAVVRQMSGKGLFAKFDSVLAKSSVKGTSSAVATVKAADSPATELNAAPLPAETAPADLVATPASAEGKADHKGFSVPNWVLALGVLALLSGLLPRRRAHKAAVEVPVED